MVLQCAFKIIKQLHKIIITSTGNQNVLTTTKAGSHAPLFFDSDGTTFVVDIAANTSVYNYSCSFIGPLVDSTVSLETVESTRGPMNEQL